MGLFPFFFKEKKKEDCGCDNVLVQRLLNFTECGKRVNAWEFSLCSECKSEA